MAQRAAHHFYETLSPLSSPAMVFAANHYVQAPADWYIACSDIKGSTAAVAAGKHPDVNFAAAAMISALTNHCGEIPYQFGGDGAVALIPPAFASDARKVLARIRRFARTEFKLDLRVGLAPVSALSERGAEILVARYEPSPGNAYAVFLGNGVEDMESAVKGRGDATLSELAIIGDGEDDGAAPDLTGLSCRWSPLRSAHGRMISLVIRGGDHGEIYNALRAMIGTDALNCVSMAILRPRWPLRGFIREAKARRGKRSLALTIPWVALVTLFAFCVFTFKIKIGNFDPERYQRELAANAVDFARSGAVLSLVFDCPVKLVEIVRAFLDERQQRGEIHYGMHLSDHAVMTCLVTSSTDNQHVHFVDGGDGGYTQAATQLKARLR